jgi:hypothetical protein
MPLLQALLAAGIVLSAGCLSLKTAPIEVKPIHITVDVNVKVDQALKNFFGNIDQKAAQP